MLWDSGMFLLTNALWGSSKKSSLPFYFSFRQTFLFQPRHTVELFGSQLYRFDPSAQQRFPNRTIQTLICFLSLLWPASHSYTLWSYLGTQLCLKWEDSQDVEIIITSISSQALQWELSLMKAPSMHTNWAKISRDLHCHLIVGYIWSLHVTLMQQRCCSSTTAEKHKLASIFVRVSNLLDGCFPFIGLSRRLCWSIRGGKATKLPLTHASAKWRWERLYKCRLASSTEGEMVGCFFPHALP